MIWPLADNIRHFAPIYTTQANQIQEKSCISRQLQKMGAPTGGRLRRAVFAPRGRGQITASRIGQKKAKKRVFLLNKNDDFT